MPPRAVLYARYSTAMQSAASVEDQLRLLRQRAQREGWAVSAEHADRAISGTVRDRPGLTAALRAIEAGEAGVLLAESLDRLSRDQEDLAALFKRVRFHGARLVTLSEGEIGTLHIGMGGTMAALFLEQLGEKVRRGQIGRVEAGRIPGGISYGYRKVVRLGADGEPERGLREVCEAEAAIVRRIFAEYAAGCSPRAIVARLNAERVPGPRGGLWRTNAVIGHRGRGNGILHNALYRGRIVFNRQRFVKDPETRRRLSRANPRDALVEHEVPDLRVVDEELWNAAQARAAAYAGRPAHQARRPKRLLSGLMRCGVCGGTATIVTADRWGCSSRFQTGACGNGVTVSNRLAQKRVWAAIDRHLLHPDVVAAYLDEWRLAAAEQRRSAIADRAALDRRLAELEREEERLVAAIAAGIPLDGLAARARDLSAERARLIAEAEAAARDAPETLIHPGMVEHYRRQVDQLHRLADADDDVRRAGRELLAGLVEAIDLTPRADGKNGADLTLHGKLAAFLTQDATMPATPEGGGHTVELVAGVGFGLCRTIPIAA